MIQWGPAFEVGYVAIDTQHRKLIDIVNRVMECMKKPNPGADLTSSFKALIDYTKTHFAMEERLMSEHRYPDTPVHKIQHVNLVGDIEKLQADLASGKQLVGSRTVLFLQNWIISHVLQTDRKLAAFLKERA